MFFCGFGLPVLQVTAQEVPESLDEGLADAGSTDGVTVSKPRDWGAEPPVSKP